MNGIAVAEVGKNVRFVRKVVILASRSGKVRMTWYQSWEGSGVLAKRYVRDTGIKVGYEEVLVNGYSLSANIHSLDCCHVFWMTYKRRICRRGVDIKRCTGILYTDTILYRFCIHISCFNTVSIGSSCM